MAAPSFSKRTAWSRTANSLALRREALESQGRELIDLTEMNPTRCGLELPEREIREALAAAPLNPYRPEPFGALGARRALSEFLQSAGGRVPPEALVLTASTSEAYSRLFQLLCDPGDNVLVPTPSYPLFEYLGSLDSVETRPYVLEVETDFGLERAGLEAAADGRTRAVLVVNPHHPTGTFLKRHELRMLEALCAERGWALICDEVFADYGIGADPERVRSVGTGSLPMLTFSLAGLSKSLALPQLKLGWMAVLGPAEERAEALARLELISDTYLSVNGPVQSALPSLLGLAPRIQAALKERVAVNRERLRARVPAHAPWSLLPAEAGWAQVLRIPGNVEEEPLCLELLEVGLVVQPGYFYDFPKGRFLVLSLLPSPEVFAEGWDILTETLNRR